MSQFSFSFQDNFKLLSPTQQKIWQIIWSLSNRYHATFPSHDLIARHAKCCRRTVINAIQKFKMMGWLDTIRRCYRSCVYFIRKELLKVNPFSKKTFMRSSRKLHNDLHSISCTSSSKKKQLDAVPKNPLISNLSFLNQEDKQYLSTKYSDKILSEAIKDCDSYHRRFWKDPIKSIKNKTAFFKGRCKQLKQKYIG